MKAAYYSKEIQMPKNKKEGLMNVVQMVINNLERDDSYEALMIAVNLLDDLGSKANPYGRDVAETNTTAAAVQKELQAKHEAEMLKVKDEWFAAGRESMKKEILGKLGLAA